MVLWRQRTLAVGVASTIEDARKKGGVT